LFAKDIESDLRCAVDPFPPSTSVLDFFHDPPPADASNLFFYASVDDGARLPWFSFPPVAPPM